MKQILKKSMLPIFFSIIFGMICGKIVYKIYLGDAELSLGENVIYLIQSGAYSSYDNMRTNTKGYDYIYYEEDNLYKTIIGITKNKDNIEKIKKAYNEEVIINEYYSNDKELNNKIIEYDHLLLNEEDEVVIKQIIIKMLNLYKKDNNDNIKLTKVS